MPALGLRHHMTRHHTTRLATLPPSFPPKISRFTCGTECPLHATHSPSRLPLLPSRPSPLPPPRPPGYLGVAKGVRSARCGAAAASGRKGATGLPCRCHLRGGGLPQGKGAPTQSSTVCVCVFVCFECVQLLQGVPRLVKGERQANARVRALVRSLGAYERVSTRRRPIPAT